MKLEETPLIGPKHFSEYSPEEWLAYVKSLKIEPKAASSGLFFSWTKKGKPSLRVTRKPPVVTQEEIEVLARENNCPISELYIIAKKKCSVLKTEEKKEKKK